MSTHRPASPASSSTSLFYDDALPLMEVRSSITHALTSAPNVSHAHGVNAASSVDNTARFVRPLSTSVPTESNINKTLRTESHDYADIWLNIENMDHFLEQIYSYYYGKGIYVILLSKFIDLITLAFLIVFTVFMTVCVDYSFLYQPPSSQYKFVHDVVRINNLFSMPLFMLCCITVFSLYWLFELTKSLIQIPNLIKMHHFYTQILGIPDSDLQTVTWPSIVDSLVSLQSKSSNQVLNAHDIANRIMRRDNYLIAMVNKSILKLSLPFVFSHPLLTQVLLWQIRYCVLDFIFDKQNKVRPHFLREFHRSKLIAMLRRRFILTGIVSLALVPFSSIFMIIYYVFKYATDVHKNLQSLGARDYSHFAKWQMREFNELPHFFERRLHLGSVPARIYLDQFPSAKVALIARFVSFVSGVFAVVLGLLSFINDDLLLHFEISPGRSLLWFLGVFGAVLATSRSLIPDEHFVFDADEQMSKVVEHLHYMPNSWRNRFHSDCVRQEFSRLFQFKIVLFAAEIVSLIIGPFILCLSLPSSAADIVDFVRDFTVHVDHLGFVCSFALFDFERHGNAKYGVATTQHNTDKRSRSKRGKMEASTLNFASSYPNWNPGDPSTGAFLERSRQVVTHFDYPLSRSQPQVEIYRHVPRGQELTQSLRSEPVGTQRDPVFSILNSMRNSRVAV